MVEDLLGERSRSDEDRLVAVGSGGGGPTLGADDADEAEVADFPSELRERGSNRACCAVDDDDVAGAHSGDVVHEQFRGRERARGHARCSQRDAGGDRHHQLGVGDCVFRQPSGIR
jgi:hypothetical protein